MSNIRRQSIIATIVVYIGFGVGLINTYFFTKKDLFTSAEYGLTTIFVQIAILMASIAGLATPHYVFKFYPYYKSRLSPKKNDIITWALLGSLAGFLMVLLLGYIFKDLVVQKYQKNSTLLITYYYWLFPLGFGLTIYTLLEAYALSLRKAVLANFLREVEWRLFTTVIIVLYITNVINDFSLFIKIYSFSYLFIALTLLIYLIKTRQLYITFKVSNVTRKFRYKIRTFVLYLYGGGVLSQISLVFDSLVIAAVLPDGLEKAGIFGLAQIMTSVIQAPQRGVVGAAIGRLSQAWKDKDLPAIQRIYERSSINLLLFSTALFSLIALNYKEAIYTFGLKEEYIYGFSAFILLGLTKVIDLGSGVNTYIIQTSSYWRIELTSNFILLSLMIPLNYFLTKEFDILGPAIANLVSISIYAIIRIGFLWKKFHLFPFSIKSFYALLISGAAFVISYYMGENVHSWAGLILRSSTFILLFGSMVIFCKISPDILPVWNNILARVGLKK